MKKNYKNIDNGKEEQLKEPSVSYQTPNKIRFYASFEEEAEDNFKYLAKLSAEQHLKNAKNLIERVFSKELKNKKRNNRINFN